LRSEGQNLAGWQGSVAGNFHRNVGIVGDFGGQYKNISGIGVSTYSALFGPRFSARGERVTVFSHFLVGAVNARAGLFGISFTQTGLGLAWGGGVDVNVGKQVAIRVAQVDWGMTRFTGEWSTNNVRYGVGVVFKFGGRHEAGTRDINQAAGVAVQRVPSGEPLAPPATSTRTPVAGTRPMIQPAPVTVALSLGITGYTTEDGFKLTSVRAGSPAAQIFLRAGDVISKIDGREVTSGQDIDVAVGASASGAVKVSGLTQTALGAIQFERETKVR